MSDRVFIDTNIIIYLYADHERDKQSVSRALINSASECITSTQILNEINNVLIKKWQLPTDTVKIVQNDVRRISDVVYIDELTIDKAIELNAQLGFSYYDCLMLASALEYNCSVVYTEDMNHGQLIHNTLKIINPFK